MLIEFLLPYLGLAISVFCFILVWFIAPKAEIDFSTVEANEPLEPPHVH